MTIYEMLCSDNRILQGGSKIKANEQGLIEYDWSNNQKSLAKSHLLCYYLIHKIFLRDDVFIDFIFRAGGGIGRRVCLRGI